MFRSCIGFALLLICMGTVRLTAQQSTTGPTPPDGIDRGLRPPDKSRIIINGVTPFIWHHGCGPTAAGMVIGFWDEYVFPQLVEGSTTTQTQAVNDMIAGDSNFPNCGAQNSDHYQDYSCPIDASPGPLLSDRSESGGVHTNNCIADFMHTSMSNFSNYYGWSWFGDDRIALTSYFQLRIPGSVIDAQSLLFDEFTWSQYKSEIDARRPMVLLVDTEGDGWTDHFVTAIGYDEYNSEYGVYDTWDHNVHWYKWQKIAGGRPWGIYGISTFHPRFTCVDADSDGYGDSGYPENQCPADNCPFTNNADQQDIDDDGLGDACDPDADNDGLMNDADNCALVINPGQQDFDSDSVGDICDNCPYTFNTEQRDENYDGIGDMCDGRLHVYTRTCPDAYLGKQYSYQLEGAGGLYPLTWTFYGGDLPGGLNFDSPEGIISGIPDYKARYFFTVVLSDSDSPAKSCTLSTSIQVTDAPVLRPCGDADHSMVLNISDAVFVINYIFAGGPAPSPIEYADVDCNAIVTISDAVYMINYIFAGGAVPCAACQ